MQKFKYDWPLILAYHSINDKRNDGLAISVEEFERQIQWLRQKRFRSITLAEYLKGNFRKGERIVVLTFDDGYLDNYTNAYPLLRKYDFTATIFVVSDYVGTDQIFSDDIQAKKHGTKYPLMQWEHLGEMLDTGIEIGSHTCTHAKLPDISDEQAKEEIGRSRADIELRLGIHVNSFCYPQGYLNEKTITYVHKSGYKGAVVTPPRGGIPLTPYTLRRVGVYQNMTPLLFRIKTHPLFRRYYEKLRYGWSTNS